MRLLAPGILLGLSLTLGAAIAYEAVAPVDPVRFETPRMPAHRTQTAIPMPYAPPSEDLFADIDARPLFSSRREPLEDLTQTGAAAAATSDFVLVGVIMGGERAVALLRNRTTSATTSAALGDLVNGWRVAKIDTTSVTLRGAGGEFVVPLDGPANAPPSTPLQPAAPSAAPAPPPQAPAPVAVQPPPAPAPAVRGAQTPSEFPQDPIIPPQRTPAVATPLPSQTVASTTPAKPPQRPRIAPEALRGAPIDPSTGEPTL